MTGEKMPNGKMHIQYFCIFGKEKKVKRKEYRRYQKKILKEELEIAG